MADWPIWAHVVLVWLLSLAVICFVAVSVWGFGEVRKIIATLARHERARAGLQLEKFDKLENRYVEKFNRNFDRIRLVSQGVEIFEHRWRTIEPDLRDRELVIETVCSICGMEYEAFASAHKFKGCLPRPGDVL